MKGPFPMPTPAIQSSWVRGRRANVCCFPAGSKKFPEDETPALAKIKIATPAHPSGTPDAGGMCAVN